MRRTPYTEPMPDLPQSIFGYLCDADIYNSHCSDIARVWFIDGKQPVYLKQAALHSLQHEATMYAYLYQHGMSPEAISYESHEGYDYLLVQAAEGEDGTHPSHVKHPERLAALYGESLRGLHELPTQQCPFRNLTHQIVQQASDKLTRLQNSTGKAQQELSQIEEACAHLQQRISDTTLIHGDYCLPNIIINKWKFNAIIDVGDAGVGDRHYDLYWGLWSLHYNLHTDKYDRCFIDAYGCELVDVDTITYISVIEAS